MQSYSTTYIAVIVNLLVTFLPKFGITAGSDELTAIIQGAVAVATGVWIIYKRYKAGGITVLGVKNSSVQ